MSQLHHLYPPPPPEKSMKRTNNVLNAPDDGVSLCSNLGNKHATDRS